MFSGPMFHYEYRATTRNRRPFVFRAVIALMFASAALLVGVFIFTANQPLLTQDRVILLGRSVFIVTLCLELLFLVFFVPAFVGGAIADERARDTLSLILLTRLRPIEILLTQTSARWLCAVNPVLTGLPLRLVSARVAGLELEVLLLAVVSSSAFMATLAILASSAREQAGAARAPATAWIFGWLLGPPLLSIMLITPANLWGMLLAELKSICALIAPSSPLSLVTDHGWYPGPGLATTTLNYGSRSWSRFKPCSDCLLLVWQRAG